MKTLVGKGAVGDLPPDEGSTLSGENSGVGVSAPPGPIGVLTGGSSNSPAPGSPDKTIAGAGADTGLNPPGRAGADGNPPVSADSGEKLSTGVPNSQEPGGPRYTSPAPVAEPARFCACGCGESLAGLRADAKYHSEACKKRAERARRRDKAGTRRRSRTRRGQGTRIYLVPKELQAVAKDLTPTSPESERFKEKLQAAGKRLESRAA